MNRKVEIFDFSSRLPGYLFVLSNLCDIHDRVLLRCPEAQSGYFSAMLAEIGLAAQVDAVSSGKDWPDYALSVCERWQDITSCLSIGADTIIAFLPSSSISALGFEEHIEGFLSQNPNIIFINEIQNGIMEKNFTVMVSQAYNAFAKLKENMLRHALNKAI